MWFTMEKSPQPVRTTIAQVGALPRSVRCCGLSNGVYTVRQCGKSSNVDYLDSVRRIPRGRGRAYSARMDHESPLDAATLRKAAELARLRANRAPRRHEDGMARLGAQRALDQLARDLEATADHEDRKR